MNAEITFTNDVAQLKIILNSVSANDRAALEQSHVDVAFGMKAGVLLFFFEIDHIKALAPFTNQMVPVMHRFRRTLKDNERINLTVILEDRHRTHAVRGVSLSCESSKCLVDLLALEEAQRWVGSAVYKKQLAELFHQKFDDLRAISSLARERAGV
jgi:hypothetical protein